MAKYYSLKEENLHEVFEVENILNISSDDLINEHCKKQSRFGHCTLNHDKLDNIYISKVNAQFNQNIRLTEKSEPLIALCFNLGAPFQQYISVKENKKYYFQQNSCGLLFINNQSESEGFYYKNTHLNFLSYYFDQNFFEKLAFCYPKLLEILYKKYETGETFTLTKDSMPITYKMQQILNQLRHEYLVGDMNNMYYESKIITLLSLQIELTSNQTVSNVETSIKSKTDYNKIHDAKEFLISDITMPLHINEIAKQVGINEDKLKKGFKEVFGNTVFGYLYDYKMSLASEYLKDHSLSVKEVALRCGYDYLSHFSTAFKRYYGCTPLQYRLKK
ncbi:MAG: helix-turn-helix transcriptional regulator [Weeksellaceae bacterium]